MTKNSKATVEEILDEDSDEGNFVVPPADVFSYTELRSCADLVRMYEEKSLDISPDFQRSFVWSPLEQTRFIDSLLKRMPIPSMCITIDSETSKRRLVDGLQRTSTIIKFLTDDKMQLSSARDIDDRLSGKCVEQLKTEAADVFEQIRNETIPVTVLRCNSALANHNEYLFQIFARLNTGGTKLTPQEIRNGIYGGTFNNFIKELSDDAVFRKYVYRKMADKKNQKSDRFKGQELVLRFFAFYETWEKYSPSLAAFLNDYMQKNRGISNSKYNEFSILFKETLDIIKKLDSVIQKHSQIVFEGLLLGIALNLDNLKQKSEQELQDLYLEFTNLSAFKKENIVEGTMNEKKVISRIHSAKTLFSK